MKKVKEEELLSLAYSDPKYAGCHVIIIGGKIYATRSGKKHAKLLTTLAKEYPKETPLITYIPKTDTLILVIY